MSEEHQEKTITINTGNTILSQYKIGVDLYKHEDSLNWTKLSYLLYVNAGLLAIVGFVYEKGENIFKMNIANNWLVFTICIVGIVSSLLFGIALQSGIYYLQGRKETIMNLEKHLIEKHDGDYLFCIPDIEDQCERYNCSRFMDKKKKFFQKSPTMLMLKSISYIFAAIWSLFAIIILFS